jgi:shikimate dehydrogenase
MREAQNLGLDYEYRIIDLLEPELAGKTIGEVVSEAAKSGYDALNVTHPFKQQVLSLLASASDEVENIGAANLVLRPGIDPHGENTDWSGFDFALRQAIPDAKRDLVLQVGAGGAGGATAYALLKWGTKHLVITDIDLSRARELAAQYQADFPNSSVKSLPMDEALRLLPQIDGVVQATPIGMYAHPGVPFDIATLAKSAWVSDVVYRPIETQLLREAKEAGHVVVSGGWMALGQAVDSLRLITGIEPNVARMNAHFLELLENESVLTRAKGI